MVRVSVSSFVVRTVGGRRIGCPMYINAQVLGYNDRHGHTLLASDVSHVQAADCPRQSVMSAL